MKKLVMVAVLISAAALFAQSQLPDPSTLTPTLTVSVEPYRGYLPAHLANGRPVYQFSVLVADEEQKMGLTSANVLMQAGETKRVASNTSSLFGYVLGAITIDGEGRARYRAAYFRDGRRVLASSATIDLVE
jgi:hypothetical protein